VFRAIQILEGVLVGWIGGACSEPIVVREAVRALADGRSRLVQIGPRFGLVEVEPRAGILYAESHCASEGTVEVLIEPQLPKPLLAVVGESPAARTLAELAGVIGWRVSDELADAADAVVVATMGQIDADALEAALGTRASYVGLIASARRAGVVQAELRARGISEEDLARVRSPAGLDLGPGSQEEIAVAIIAELVAWSHRLTTAALPDTAGLVEARDPVCGMAVAVAGAQHGVFYEGAQYWFCGAGCRARFQCDPARYADVAPETVDG
jgi:xanthine dehydrogenase accessory factor